MHRDGPSPYTYGDVESYRVYEAQQKDVTAAHAVAGIVNGAIVVGAGFLLVQAWTAAHSVLIFRLNGTPIYVGLGVIAALLIAGALFSFLRDVRYWRSIAVLQIAIAVTVATYGYVASLDLALRVSLLVGALVQTANGFDKLTKARIEKKRSQSV